MKLPDQVLEQLKIRDNARQYIEYLKQISLRETSEYIKEELKKLGLDVDTKSYTIAKDGSIEEVITKKIEEEPNVKEN